MNWNSKTKQWTDLKSVSVIKLATIASKLRYIGVYIVIYIAGLATGMYLSSQIEKDIDNRTKK